MNKRDDRYGGSPRARGRFAAEVVAECKRRLDPGMPVILRISQWKMVDYAANMAESPQELEELLAPAVDGLAGGGALFDYAGAPADATAKGLRLTLLSSQPREGGVMWLRYRVERSAARA